MLSLLRDYLTHPSLSFSTVNEEMMRDIEGFLLVYSISSRTTLTEIQYYYSMIRRVKRQYTFPAVVLLGNKCDLEEERAITMDGESW